MGLPVTAAEWSEGAAGPVLRLVALDPHGAHWWDFAACLGTDTEAFFPARGGSITYPKRLCRRCPVTAQCLEDALEFEATHVGGPVGVWGGLSPDERRRLKRSQEAA